MEFYLYRNHTPACKTLLVETTYRRLTGTQQKKAIVRHRDCNCQWWYRRKGQPHGKATGHTDETEAKSVVNALRAYAKDPEVHGETLAVCIEKYTAHIGSTYSKGTKKHYRLLFENFAKFTTLCEITHIRQITVDHILDFKDSAFLPGIKGTTKGMMFRKLMAFFTHAYGRGWISEPLTVKIKALKLKFKAQEDAASPYTEDEISRILELSGTLNGASEDYGKVPGTFRLLCELMNEAALRVSDTTDYDPANCTPVDETTWKYSYYPHKHNRTITPKLQLTYIKSDLKLAIDQCVWMSATRPFAPEPVTEDNLETFGRKVYRRLQLIGSKLGIKDCRPHRFRDSCAVRWLEKGLGIEVVCQLLGHSKIEITWNHYSGALKDKEKRAETAYLKLVA